MFKINVYIISIINNKNIDKSIKEILKYANSNEMIPKTGVEITVTGRALKYNALWMILP